MSEVRLGVLPHAEVSQFDVTKSRLDSFSIHEIEMNHSSQAQTSEVSAKSSVSMAGLARRLAAGNKKTQPEMKDTYLSFKKAKIEVGEHLSQVSLKVVRTGNLDRKTVVRYHPKEEPGDEARAGVHYSAAYGSLIFRRGEAEKEILVGIYDLDGKDTTRCFHIVLDLGMYHLRVHLGEPSAVRVKIVVEKNTDWFVIVLFNVYFQVLVFFCTAFALFGNDLAVVYGDKESDKYVTPVTVFNIAVFTLELILMIGSRGKKYLFSVNICMDAMALFGLVALIPDVALVLGSGASVGVLARAGRAARVASRAGRTVKLPKLLAKMVQVSIDLGLMNKTESKEEEVAAAAQAADEDKLTQLLAEEEAELKELQAELQEVTAEISEVQETHHMAPGDAVDMDAIVVKVVGTDGRDVEADPSSAIDRMRRSSQQVMPSPGLALLKSKKAALEASQKKLFSKKEQLMTAAASKANLAMQSETGRVGAMLMELITGKVILMMLMVLVVSALLTVVADPYQKEQGLDFMEALGTGGSSGANPLFDAAMAHYKKGDPAGTHYNPSEPLIYLKVSGTEFNEGLDTGKLKSVRILEFNVETKCRYRIKHLVSRLTGENSKCDTVAIFDNSKAYELDSANSMIMTVCIVLILALGMGLMGIDFQNLLGEPVEHINMIFGLLMDIFSNLKGNMLAPIEDEDDDDDADGPNPKEPSGLSKNLRPYHVAITAVQRGFVQYRTIHYALLQLSADIENSLSMPMIGFKNKLIDNFAFLLDMYDTVDKTLISPATQVLGFETLTKDQLLSTATAMMTAVLPKAVVEKTRPVMSAVESGMNVVETLIMNQMVSRGFVNPEDALQTAVTFRLVRAYVEQMAINVILAKVDLAIRMTGQTQMFHIWLENRPIITNFKQLNSYAMFLVVAMVYEALDARGVAMPQTSTISLDQMQSPEKTMHALEHSVRGAMEAHVTKLSGLKIELPALLHLKDQTKAHEIKKQIENSVRTMMSSIVLTQQLGSAQEVAALSMVKLHELVQGGLEDGTVNLARCTIEEERFLKWYGKVGQPEQALRKMMPTSLSDLLGNHPLVTLIEKLVQVFHSDDDNVSHATDFVESLAKKALEVGESPGSVSVMALSGLATSMNMYRNLRTTTSKMGAEDEEQDEAATKSRAAKVLEWLKSRIKERLIMELTAHGIKMLQDPNNLSMEELQEKLMVMVTERWSALVQLVADQAPPESVLATIARTGMLSSGNAKVPGVDMDDQFIQDKLRSFQSLASASMSGLPSVQEMQAIPSEKFAQLLEKVNYPDAFKNRVPDSVSMPSREALNSMKREEAVAKLLALEHSVMANASGMRSSMMDKLRSFQSSASAGMSELPSVQEMQAMPSEKFEHLLENGNYPDAFKNLVPNSVSMPSREALNSMKREVAVAKLLAIRDSVMANASGMRSSMMDKLRSFQSSASASMSGLPSVQEMQAMPSDKFAQLLEKVNYPDAFKDLVPNSVSMPSREALNGMKRAEAVAKLLAIKDSVMVNASGIGISMMDKLRSFQSSASAGMSGLPSVQEMQAMPSEKFEQLLEKVNYPDAFKNLMPDSVSMPSRQAVWNLYETYDVK